MQTPTSSTFDVTAFDKAMDNLWQDFVLGRPIGGGMLFEGNVRACCLDESVESLKHLDRLLLTIKKQLTDTPEITLLKDSKFRNFVLFLASYVGRVLAKASAMPVSWRGLDELRQAHKLDTSSGKFYVLTAIVVGKGLPFFVLVVLGAKLFGRFERPFIDPMTGSLAPESLYCAALDCLKVCPMANQELPALDDVSAPSAKLSQLVAASPSSNHRENRTPNALIIQDKQDGLDKANPSVKQDSQDSKPDHHEPSQEKQPIRIKVSAIMQLPPKTPWATVKHTGIHPGQVVDTQRLVVGADHARNPLSAQDVAQPRHDNAIAEEPRKTNPRATDLRQDSQGLVGLDSINLDKAKGLPSNAQSPSDDGLSQSAIKPVLADIKQTDTPTQLATQAPTSKNTSAPKARHHATLNRPTAKKDEFLEIKQDLQTLPAISSPHNEHYDKAVAVLAKAMRATEGDADKLAKLGEKQQATITQAVKLLEKLGNMGNTNAMLSFALLSFEGVFVPQDKELGVKWVEKAAKFDDIRAQKLLSRLYYQGFGVPSSVEMGQMWLDKAAAGGHPEAKKLQAQFGQVKLMKDDYRMTVQQDKRYLGMLIGVAVFFVLILWVIAKFLA